MIKIVMTITQMLKGALWFGTLGPPIGALPLWVAMYVTKLAVGIGNDVPPSPFIDTFFALVFFSYLFGLIPAILSGLIVGPFCQFAHSWPRYICIGLLSSLVSFVWGVIYYLPKMGEATVSFLATFYLAPAFVAGTIVARLWAHRPDKSYLDSLREPGE